MNAKIALSHFATACLGLFILIPFAPALAAVNCGIAAPTSVTVTQSFDDIQYEFYASMLNIKDLANDAAEKGHKENWPIGLSTGELFVRAESDIQSRQNMGDGSICGSLKNLRIQLGFTDNKVYVARELLKRSCPHRVVLDHEQMHKKVDYELMKEYAERAKTFFEEAAAGFGVQYEHDPRKLDALFNAFLNEKLKAFTDEMSAERTRRQALVDSEDEYARVAASCDGQLNDVISQRLDQFENSDPALVAKYKMIFTR